ncbi:invasion associated locus B family protein [Novosphingobium resinovorum]|uniref:invasion associated locus B family protein n=1 Tax=Novosphingobium resinovorum TaxID=158500 RepID=UPI002ED1138D|nr:invasion associated locus B family protein [Novosphingobium resinovorum]
MKIEVGNMLRLARVVAGLAAAVMGTVAATAADGPSPALRERFGDWGVTCVTVEKGTKCSILQQQAARAAPGQALQRTIAIELLPVPYGAVGTLLTPFGVDLAKGVTLRLGKAGPPLPFKTCLPTGCLVPLQFGKDAVEALRHQPVLHVLFETAGDGQTIDVPISLGGLGQALDRAKAIETGDGAGS